MRYVVIGGGVSGLAAAWRLRQLAGDPADIVVLEETAQLGGKISTGSMAGLVAEQGAETFLMHDRGEPSAALRLAHAVGLQDDLVHPAAVPPAIAIPRADGTVLRSIPPATLFGIPANAQAVAGIADLDGRDQDAGSALLGPGEDIAVGTLVRERFGDEVADLLVDPMLGGVYAGSADGLSLAATMPALHASVQHHTTLAGAVDAVLRGSGRPVGAPVFAGVRGGLGRLVSATAAAARADVRTNSMVRELARTSAGWRVATGARDVINADAVVLAVPARPAALLLGSVDPAVAAAAGRVHYANVALVTLALPAHTPLPTLSGFLVPAVCGRAVKAVTFFTTKWPHLRTDEAAPVLVRASFGRYGDASVINSSDEELAALAHREVSELTGMVLPEPIATTVNRWPGCLPQYAVGHLARVADVRRRLPATLAVAGAAYDGVGIAACVRSGQVAAEAVHAAVVSTVPGATGLEQSWT